jgi:hypothetical protein
LRFWSEGAAPPIGPPRAPVAGSAMSTTLANNAPLTDARFTNKRCRIIMTAEPSIPNRIRIERRTDARHR